MSTYYTYIMASASRVLYVGVTNDLQRRVWEHKAKLIPGFTHKHNVTRLVHFEEYSDIRDAIAREKQIKGWRRRKKIALIEQQNGTWKDLAWGWFDSASFPTCHPELAPKAFGAGEGPRKNFGQSVEVPSEPSARQKSTDNFAAHPSSVERSFASLRMTDLWHR